MKTRSRFPSLGFFGLLKKYPVASGILIGVGATLLLAAIIAAIVFTGPLAPASIAFLSAVGIKLAAVGGAISTTTAIAVGASILGLATIVLGGLVGAIGGLFKKIIQSKTKEINPNKINKKTEAKALKKLITIMPEGRLKKNQLYQIDRFTKIKLTHSIVVGKDSSFHRSSFYYVLPGKGNGQLGSGSSASVKAVKKMELHKDNFKKNPDPWVIKKMNIPSEFDEVNPNQLKIDAQDELNAANEINAKDIQANTLIEIKKNQFGFFMRNTGNKLNTVSHHHNEATVPILDMAAIANILNDLLKHAINAIRHNRVMVDIKLDNITYKKGVATIIDHGSSKSFNKAFKPMLTTPFYSPPESPRLDNSDATQDDAKRVMVFQIGIAIAELIAGPKALYQERMRKEVAFHEAPINSEALDPYYEENPKLINLVKKMIKFDENERIDLYEAAKELNEIRSQIGSVKKKV